MVALDEKDNSKQFQTSSISENYPLLTLNCLTFF